MRGRLARPLRSSQGSLGLGIVLGVLGGTLVGLIWFVVVIVSRSPALYIALFLGSAVGYSIQLGARRHGDLMAALSIVVAGVVLVVWLYVINRVLLVNKGYRVLPDRSIPIWPTYTTFRDVLRVAFKETPLQYAFAGVSLAISGWLGYRGIERHRRDARRLARSAPH